MKNTFYFLFLILFLMHCSNKSESTIIQLSSHNPFNIELNVPIDYANVTGDALEEYVDVTISNAKMDLEALKSENSLSFENIFIPLDQINNELSKAYSNAHMLFWVSPDSIARKKGLEGHQKIAPLFTDIYSDKTLFSQIEKFINSEDYKKISGHKKILVDDMVDNFKNSGVNLNAEDLEKYKKLNAEVNELTSQYSTNMNTANLVLVLDEKGIEGLSESFKEKYKNNQGYEIPVISSTSGPVMSNAKIEETRKEFTTKYSNRGADKNLVILDSLVSKRYQIAKLMDFESFAAYNLKPKMAKNPQIVWDFINDLVAKSKTKALQDVEVLKKTRNAELKINGDKPINPWDISYYNNQILKTQFNVDHEKIREYLPMKDCLNGMFEIYQQLLGLEFKKVENPSVWHQEIEMYNVYEGEKLKGRFYLDLFPRANKESWFYGVGLSEGRMTPKGYEVPVAMLLGNFTRPTDVQPSLLTHRELSTLFHEFGHIVSDMSYEGEFSSQAGPKRDFAEAMSQIFENWIWDYDILSSFAKHYKTGEVLPKKMFDNMIKAKNVSSGLGAQGTLRRCIYDMNLYDKYNPSNPIDTDQLWRDIDNEMGVMSNYIEGTHPQASWIHINTHPVYMYGYLWSEVYAQDMFTVFEKNGLKDPETGIRYRKLILSNGSQRDIVEAVEEFLGRPSNNEAYIKSLGFD